MARLAHASAIYAAVERWVTTSISRDDSVFEPGMPLWSVENIHALETAFTGNPLHGNATFEAKLEEQLKELPSEVKMLAAEMLWVLFLFPRKVLSVERKRELITNVWGWARELGPNHPRLSDTMLAGIGNAGTAFNTQRDRELEGLIAAVLALKERAKLGPYIDPNVVAGRIDSVPEAARRNIRNILLHLMFPDAFEHIVSAARKREIVQAFSDLLPEGQRPASEPLIKVDHQLFAIRQRLEEKSPGTTVDFYESPFRERWLDVAVAPAPAAAPKRKGTSGEVTSGRFDPAGRGDSVDPAGWHASPEELARSGADMPAKSTGPSRDVAQEVAQSVVVTPSEPIQRQEDDAPRGGTGPGETTLSHEVANDETRAGVLLAWAKRSIGIVREPTPEDLFVAYMALTVHPRYKSPAAIAVSDALGRAKGYAEAENPADTVKLFPKHYQTELSALREDLPEIVSPGLRLAPIFAAADALRGEVRAPGAPLLRISPRHVLAVLLLPGPHSAVVFLGALGFSVADLRRALLESVLKRRLGENRDAWRNLLLGDQELPPDIPFYAGFSTDAIASDESSAITRKDDRLDVMRDVTALCEVLAAHKTDPPLAVGLFGDWGTGKSFFMKLMEQEIGRLGTENPEFYCDRVVQVWFNAWHYMDTNLWASLAARVFEELAEHLERWKQPESSRTLFDQLQESRGVLAEAVSERTAASTHLAGIREERQAKETSIAATAATAFQAATAALSADPEVQRKLRDAKDRLGLTAAQADVTRAAEQARQLRTLGGRMAALGRMLLQRPVFLLLGILISAAVIVGARLLIENTGIFAGPSRVIAGLAAWIVALGAAVAPVAARVSRGVAWLEDVATRLQQRRDAEQRQEDLAIQRDLMRLEEREREARTRVETLTREIDELRAGRRLQRFILERHTSAEYRQHLGLVNLIRNDFERLSELLSTSRKEGAAPAAPTANAAAGAEAAAPAPPLPRIDRIVLYIDDLDRCPEDRVVEVLQAVHLLLAFPLFVVVVGVDSRWLLLSLEDHYAALRGTAGEPHENGRKPESGWNTTPQNYLEKIFQIPFTLRPMEAKGFGRLVDTLLPAASTESTGSESGLEKEKEIDNARDQAHAGAGASDRDTAIANDDFGQDGEENEEEAEAAGEDAGSGEAGGEDAGGGEVGGEEADGDGGRVGAAAPKDEETLAPRPNPQGLTVEKFERAFVAQLHPLIASPRALKRFTNVYRFLRVQQRGVELARFRGTGEAPGEFQVVALLLAVIVGYPAEAPALLRAVLTERDKAWWTLVDEMDEPSASAGAARHAPPDGAHGRPTLREALLEVKRTVEIAEHRRDTYGEWAREVARFSFQSGRILSLRDPSPDEAPKLVG